MWLAAGAAAGALVVAGGAVNAFAAGGWTVTAVNGTPGNNVALNGVFARAGTDAWAVGTQFGPAGSAPPPVTYHWNGTAWSLISTPAVGGNAALFGISATSTRRCSSTGTARPGRWIRPTPSPGPTSST